MMLLQRTVQSAAPAITAFVMRETAELRNVKKDLIFFLSAAKLCRSFSDRGLKWCFPESCPPDDKAFTVKNMFNPLLVVSGRETIVPNDIELKKGGEILIMTGANQGGKTVFLMSVGLTQWLYQLGIAVPCEHASLSPVKSIFTVFAPNKSESRQRGLLAEEAGHIAAAVGGIRENCMALFNEPLTSTSPSETKSISLEIIAAFKAAGVRGIWVTHIHELAFMRKKLEQNIPWGSALGSLKIVMDQTGSESTYKITRAEPDFNSHAYDVLRRKGVTLQSGT
jgi:DNA mismatch repair ATPase MutS